MQSRISSHLKYVVPEHPPNLYQQSATDLKFHWALFCVVATNYFQTIASKSFSFASFQRLGCLSAPTSEDALCVVFLMIFKKIRHVPRVPENYLGSWYLIRVYFENIRSYRKLKRLKMVDLLSDDEIQRFEMQTAN